MSKVVEFPYGKQKISYDFENENFYGSLVSSLHGFKEEKDGLTLVKEALENPVGTEKLSVLAKDKKNIV